jgi:hypothetical protein
VCQILLRTYGLTIDADNDVTSTLATLRLGAQASSRRWGPWEDVQHFHAPHLPLDKRFPTYTQIRLPNGDMGAGVGRDGGDTLGLCRDALLGSNMLHPVLADCTGSESQQAKDHQTGQKPPGDHTPWYKAFRLVHSFPTPLPSDV